MAMSTADMQLWKEEPERLLAYAERVPDGGIIVEIGTADGGTARLLHDHCRGRRVEIWTVDLAPTRRAQELLAGTPVHLVAADSPTYALRWAQTGRKADLLFIDGDHTFAGVHRDYYSWLPHVARAGWILFHDVDPPERGGVAHLGIRVFVQTLVEEGRLEVGEHAYRFLLAQAGKREPLPLATFDRTVRRIADSIAARVARGAAWSTGELIAALARRDDGLTALDACYELLWLWRHDPEAVRHGARDREAIIRAGEMLQMLEHAYGHPPFPERMDAWVAPPDIPELSRRLAAEQVRLNVLRSALASLVEWTP